MAGLCLHLSPCACSHCMYKGVLTCVYKSACSVAAKLISAMEQRTALHSASARSNCGKYDYTVRFFAIAWYITQVQPVNRGGLSSARCRGAGMLSRVPYTHADAEYWSLSRVPYTHADAESWSLSRVPYTHADAEYYSTH